MDYILEKPNNKYSNNEKSKIEPNFKFKNSNNNYCMHKIDIMLINNRININISFYIILETIE